MSLAQFDERIPVNPQYHLLAADGTNAVTLFTAGVSGARLDDIFLINSDTIAHVVRLYVTQGATTTCIGSISVPSAQGLGGTPPIFAFATLGPANQLGWLLAPAAKLDVKLEVAMQAASFLDVTGFGGEL